MKKFEFKGFIAISMILFITICLLLAYFENNFSWLFLFLAIFSFFYISIKAKFDHFNKVLYKGDIQGDIYYEIEKVYKFHNIFLQDLVTEGKRTRVFNSLNDVNEFIASETEKEIKNSQKYSKKESKIYIES